MTGESTREMDAAVERLRRAADALEQDTSPPPVDPATLPRFSPDLPGTLEPAEREELAAAAQRLGPWFQGPFLLGGDLAVGGPWRSDRRWARLSGEIPADLAGRRVLDVGCNAGYDCFSFALRGAEYVLGAEPSVYRHQAAFLESVYGAGVDFQEVGWRGLDPDEHGRFDLIHCNGVLYHEPHPLALLERLRALLTDDGELFLGSIMLAAPDAAEHMRFVPGSFAGDPTWWWVPGRLALRWMLEMAGFTVDREFGHIPGVPGEFEVVEGYFRARGDTPAFYDRF